MVVRAVAALAVNKMMAVAFGPAGVALLAHFQNLMALLIALPADGVNRGFIKLVAADHVVSETASLKSNKKEQLTAAIIWVLLWMALAIGITLLFKGWFFERFIDLDAVSNSSSHSLWLMAFYAALLLHLLHLLLVSALLARRQLMIYALLQVTISSFSVGLVWWLSGVVAIRYVLIGFLSAQAFGFLFSVILIGQMGFLPLRFTASTKKHFFFLSRFVLMALSVALFGRTSDFYVRELAIDHFGLEQAGLWQAVVRLSDGYLMAVPAFINMVFYPELSALANKSSGLKSYFRSTLAKVIPLAAVGLALVYILREPLLVLLNNDTFLTAAPLVKYQLIGDIFKLVSYFFAVLIWVQARPRLTFITEMLSASFYVLLVWLLIKPLGLAGLPVAHAIRYAGYCLLLVFIFRKDV